MDIQIRRRTKWFSQTWHLVLVVGLALGLIGLMLFWLMRAPEIRPDGLWMAPVQQGDLTLTVSGYGKLKSADNRWLVAERGGVVTEIKLKPGARVKKGEILLLLSNAALQAETEKAKTALAEQEAEFASQDAQMQSELLQQRGRLRRVQGEWSATKLEMEANQKLAESGVVSRLNFEKLRLKTGDLQEQVQMELDTGKRLEEIQIARRAALRSRVSQFRSGYENLLRKSEDLIVRADRDGTLNALADDLMPGKQVTPGGVLAELVSEAKLFAEIEVPASKAVLLSVGQQAEIAIQEKKVAAVVTRIDPRARNDLVVVDLQATERFPAGARVELPVSAAVALRTLKAATYVQRPPKISPMSTSWIYVAETQQADMLNKRKIEFGEEAGPHVLIRAGVSAGEVLAIGPDATEDSAQSLRLNKTTSR